MLTNMIPFKSNTNHYYKKEYFAKYTQNLFKNGNDIYSYYTKVAEIKGNKLYQLGYWSTTTQKHINYVANELGLSLIK
jgi:hypothetical protein